MRYASSLVTALAASVLGVLTVPAQATPVSGIARDVEPIASEGMDVEQVRYGCYWHRGHWHCPRYRRYYGERDYYYEPRRHHHRHWRHHDRRHRRY